MKKMNLAEWVLEEREGVSSSKRARAKGLNRFENGWLSGGEVGNDQETCLVLLNFLMASTPDSPWLLKFLFIYSFHPSRSPGALFFFFYFFYFIYLFIFIYFFFKHLY